MTLVFGFLGLAFALYIYLVLSFVNVGSIGLWLLSFVFIGAGALCFRALLKKLLLGKETNSGKFQATFYSSFAICAILVLFII